MDRITAFLVLLLGCLSTVFGQLDCPPDSSFHTDNRVLLLDCSPNPTYGQEIATGLSSCINFLSNMDIDGDELTFTIRMIDNEPISGLQLDLYTNTS